MKKIVNTTLRLYLKTRYNKIEYNIAHPKIIQADLLENLLYIASDTSYGRRHDFAGIDSYEKYQKKVPLVDYDDLKPFIERMMLGERDVLWPGQVKWYAKSSGTTSDRSKFIPVSKQNLKDCHINGSWDTVAILYHNLPEAKIFEYKNLIIGGTVFDYEPFPDTKYGDVSAIMIHEMPFIGRPFYVPDFETAFMKEWEEKIERIAQMAAAETDITSIGGVPTWNIVLFHRILEITGKKHLLEVWPNLQVYVHGGVNFEPYRAQFRSFIPKDDFIYQETYNASEGYFATQNDYHSKDMLLLVDNGVFYEFIQIHHVNDAAPEAIPLDGVDMDVDYAMVISTSSGLWRYMLGDTIRFTSLDPYKIMITGRTKHFINAFGEEVMVSNTDQAISMACQDTDVKIRDYTVAPVYFTEGGKGGHEWLIEFEKPAENLEIFADVLDTKLQLVNSDYQAKRYRDMALRRLQITSLPKGAFQDWLKQRGRQGAQIKVPRLSNDRTVVEDILQMTSKTAAV
ncbi:MAG: GH3 auxin-responsive promoter family protein [Saprospiraceae bacterium]|nr:GH3 auxin-responsive promoter family protein [Saprospiraceae bacterium]